MLRIVARDSAMAVTTSVPVPMAIPTSASGQGGGVVDAVADHAHAPARALESDDLAGQLAERHRHLLGRRQHVPRYPLG